MKGKKLCMAVLTFVLMLTALPVSAAAGRAAAEKTGSIQIILKDLHSQRSVTEGVKFRLWKVGTVDEKGAPAFERRYGIEAYPETGEELVETVEKLEGEVCGEPDRLEETDAQGTTSFCELERGIYLIRAEEDNPYGLIAPSLISLPYWNGMEGMKGAWVYEAEIRPKALPHPASSQIRLGIVQTGDVMRPGAAGFLLAASFCILAGWAFRYGRGKRGKQVWAIILTAALLLPSFDGAALAGSLPADGTWSFDAYYVDEEDRYHVEKDRDFQLKYQMEFHNSRDLEADAVEIRIPAALLSYRDGTKILPSDIGVPRVQDREEPVYSRSTPFNCYIDENDELVFFNYRAIASGSNAAWQVLYQNLEMMEIEDGTSWTLTPRITVLDSQETRETTPLTGLTDSFVTLGSVSKTAYADSGKSYTPGLYTQEQVYAYLGKNLPEAYAGEHFGEFRFVVWDVRIKGSGNQPWNLAIRDVTSAGEDGAIPGNVVGYRAYSTLEDRVLLEAGKDISPDIQTVKEGCKEARWGSRFYVVTAYPITAVPEGTLLRNDITVELQPYDKKDPVQSKTASAEWSCQDYHWNYPPGEMLSVTKKEDERYAGWLEAYQHSASAGKDFGSFPFTTEGRFRGYKLTHSIGSEEDGAVPAGTYREGTGYTLTTVDDLLYACPAGVVPTAQDRLSWQDYYFTEVRVAQREVGYDIWEDRVTEPLAEEGMPQPVEIYAMYRDSEEWEKAASVTWDPSGVMEYCFTPDQLARQPWRVKAEHESTQYATSCRIDVQVRLRAESPVMGRLLQQYRAGSLTEVRLENVSGVFGTARNEAGESISYYADGGALYRDSAVKYLTGLGRHAAAYKTVRSSNDPNNSRVLLTYSLTAHDGYEIYGEEGVSVLKNAGAASPGRKAVAFYDLLPYGVRFDPSGEVTAGRITNFFGEMFTTQPRSWDKSQVSVKVDSRKDIIEDWRGTGRTMVIFHIVYSGGDPAVCTEKQWLEGWGVSFRAYYDWKDLDVVQDGSNICAFMPEERREEALCGTDSEVAFDNGRTAEQEILTGEYAPFAGGGIYEGDVQNREVRNVLYAKAVTEEDVALANESKIEKLVRADEDRFGIFGKSAVVEAGGYYTYDITVRNGDSLPLKNLVVYDRLENAAEDRGDSERDPYYPFEANCWQGTFQEVIKTGPEELGIVPVIYYNAQRSASVGTGAQKPEEILTAENGWYPAEDFAEATGKGLEEVRAVAVDLSRTAAGEFELASMKSVTFQIRMRAPAEQPEALYAYNNPSFYSVHTGTDTAALVEGNSVRVGIKEAETLEIVKVFGEYAPEAVRDTSFEFLLWQREEEKTSLCQSGV